MFNISDFLRLKKFQKIETEQKLVKEIFIQESKNFNLFLQEKQLTVKNGVIFVNAPATLKNELFFNKISLLEKLNNRSFGKINDIR